MKGFSQIWIIVGIVVLAAISGAFYLGKSSTKPLPTPVVTSQTSQPTSAPDVSPAPTGAGETTNWKTYTNSKEGFSLKYPPNTLEDSREADPFPVARQFSVNNSKDPLRYFDGWLMIISETQPNPNNWSLIEWAKNLKKIKLMFTDQEIQSGIGTSPKDTSIGGKTAIVWRGYIEGVFIYYLIQRDNGVTFITINIGGDESKYKPTIDQILSTFKFQ